MGNSQAGAQALSHQNAIQSEDEVFKSPQRWVREAGEPSPWPWGVGAGTQLPRKTGRYFPPGELSSRTRGKVSISQKQRWEQGGRLHHWGHQVSPEPFKWTCALFSDFFFLLIFFKAEDRHWVLSKWLHFLKQLPSIFSNLKILPAQRIKSS